MYTERKIGSARESVRASGFGWVFAFRQFDQAAAVAVGMWKAAFCSVFQARRALTRMLFGVFLPGPSERHFHSELLNFQHVSRFWSVWGC